jgi:competence protein ComEA
MALVSMAASWITAGGPGGGVVNIDAVEPLPTTFQIDLNSAEWTELMQLPEIGEALAKRIVESRQLDGPFTSHNDLDRVRGIGPKTLEGIRPFLRPME